MEETDGGLEKEEASALLARSLQPSIRVYIYGAECTVRLNIEDGCRWRLRGDVRPSVSVSGVPVMDGRRTFRLRQHQKVEGSLLIDGDAKTNKPGRHSVKG